MRVLGELRVAAILGVLFYLIHTNSSERLRTATLQIARNHYYGALLLYSLVLAVLLTSVGLIFNLLGHWVDVYFGLSTQETRSWLRDYAKRALIPLGMGLVWTVCLYGGMQFFRGYWWVVSWIALSLSYLT
jgi:hypothetical protein